MKAAPLNSLLRWGAIMAGAVIIGWPALALHFHFRHHRGNFAQWTWALYFGVVLVALACLSLAKSRGWAFARILRVALVTAVLLLIWYALLPEY